MSGDEREALDHFASIYAGGLAPVAVAIERAVIGGDWGANGYLTRPQADELATLLWLGPDRVVPACAVPPRRSDSQSTAAGAEGGG